jgi:hypothetical protein
MFTLFGLPPLLNAGEQSLPIFLQGYDGPTYKSNSVLIYGNSLTTAIFAIPVSRRMRSEKDYSMSINPVRLFGHRADDDLINLTDGAFRGPSSKRMPCRAIGKHSQE